MFDHLYSEQKVLEVSEAMNNPSDQRSENHCTILIDSMAKELRMFQEISDQTFKN